MTALLLRALSQVTRAEPQVQPDMVVRISGLMPSAAAIALACLPLDTRASCWNGLDSCLRADSGVVYKEIVNWCARSTFYSEKAAWKEFDRRSTTSLHVTAYNRTLPLQSPGQGHNSQHYAGTDFDFQESGVASSAPQPLVLSQQHASPAAISPVISRLCGDDGVGIPPPRSAALAELFWLPGLMC